MSELRTIASQAGALVVGQLAIMAFSITDTIVAGRYSQQVLAALSVGSAIYLTVFATLMSVVRAFLPTWAELHGGQRHHDLGRSVRQALYPTGLSALLGCWVLLFPDAALRWTEIPAELQGEVRRYLTVLALALPPALLFRMYATLNQSLGRPLLVTWLQALSLLVKIPLTIWFAFGGLGMTPQGVEGCAWASVLVEYLFVVCALWLLRTGSLYRPYALWQAMERPDWRIIAQFARLGVPSGLVILVEVSSFTLMALFIARQGTLATAAHQIAANLATLLFIVPMSIAIATSARVSYWLGAGQATHARRSIRTGLKLGLVLALIMAGILVMGRSGIAAVYSSSAEVRALATRLLAWLAAYHLGDAIQALCVFLLRCYRVAVAPLIAYCLLLWGGGPGRWLCAGLSRAGALAFAALTSRILGDQYVGPGTAQPCPADNFVANRSFASAGRLSARRNRLAGN